MRWIAALLVLAVAAPAVASPPRVEIRAQTKLVFEKLRPLGDGLAEVRGSLIDGLTGDALGGQVVSIRIAGVTATATTNTDGRFHLIVPAVPVDAGPQPIELAFRGSEHLESAELHQTSDPTRLAVALAFDFEEAPGGVNVTVRATADDQPVKLPVALSAGGSAETALAPLGNAITGAPFLLTRKAAGGPGTRKVRAVFAGDDAHQPATEEKTVELSAGSTTTMAVNPTQLAFEDALDVTGKVTDDDGKPVAHAAVTLASGDRRLAQGATGEDGSYKFNLEGEVLGRGQWGLQVQAEPSKPSVKASRSAPQIVRVAAPQPVPVSYTIAAFLATACAAGGFFAARAKPWRRLRRAAPPAEAPTPTNPDDQAEGGLVVAKPGLVSTLRRPSDDGFSGAVRDTVRGRAIGEAVVRLQLRDGRDPRETHTGADGGFAFESLAAGDWLAEVAAPGHMTETFAVSIPHRGELRGVRVDLVPVRERVFQLYRRAAEPILPEPRLWGVWSPRQIVDHVRSRRPSPALAELTTFVEEVYFSPRLAGEAVIPQASEQVDRAIRERANAAV